MLTHSNKILLGKVLLLFTFQLVIQQQLLTTATPNSSNNNMNMNMNAAGSSAVHPAGKKPAGFAVLRRAINAVKHVSPFNKGISYEYSPINKSVELESVRLIQWESEEAEKRVAGPVQWENIRTTVKKVGNEAAVAGGSSSSSDQEAAENVVQQWWEENEEGEDVEKQVAASCVAEILYTYYFLFDWTNDKCNWDKYDDQGKMKPLSLQVKYKYTTVGTVEHIVNVRYNLWDTHLFPAELMEEWLGRNDGQYKLDHNEYARTGKLFKKLASALHHREEGLWFAWPTFRTSPPKPDKPVRPKQHQIVDAAEMSVEVPAEEMFDG